MSGACILISRPERMELIAFGEAVFTASVIVSGLYAAYAVAFEVLDAYRYRQGQRTT